MNKCTKYRFCDAAINRFPALKPSGTTTALERLLDSRCKNSSSLSSTLQDGLQAIPLNPLCKGLWIYSVEVWTQPEDRPFLFCPFISLFFLIGKNKSLLCLASQYGPYWSNIAHVGLVKAFGDHHIISHDVNGLSPLAEVDLF